MKIRRTIIKIILCILGHDTLQAASWLSTLRSAIQTPSSGYSKMEPVRSCEILPSSVNRKDEAECTAGVHKFSKNLGTVPKL